MSPHRIVTAPRLAEPSGYAHAVVAEPGTLVYLGGQTAQGSDGAIRGSTILEQFDVAEYRASLADLGGVYRRHFGHHYPAMALLGVSALFDEAARIELVGVAVIPRVSDPAG